MPSTTSPIEWRFGGFPEDPEAWYAAPAHVHVYVDVRTPETPPGHWHRTWAVTRSWVSENLLSAEGAVVPPLLVVADGSPKELHDRLDRLIQDGWQLIVRSATLLEHGQQEFEW